MPTTPSDTVRRVLTAAASHPDRLATPPARLPRGPANAIARLMLAEGWVECTEAPQDGLWYPEPGEGTGLRVTAAGLDAIGLATPSALAEPPAAVDAEPAKIQVRRRLRDAVQAVLAAWDAERDGRPDLAAAMDDLRAAAAPRAQSATGGAPGARRPPRTDNEAGGCSCPSAPP
jgi:hypothetical protein